MNRDKRSYLNRAKELLATREDAVLRYACLELRFCVEAIVYAKLQTYASRLPQRVLSKWQPPQAMRALLAIEPHAAKGFTLAVAFQSTPGVPASGPYINMGSHKSIDPTWLNKHYNKLGSFLHVPLGGAKSKDRNADALREYLGKVIDELEPIVASRIDASLANTLSFTCSECGEAVVCNHEGVLASSKATCLNPGCEAEYSAVRNDATGEIDFFLIATAFRCLACESPTMVEKRKIKIGFRFKCRQCEQKHEISKIGWQYSTIGHAEPGANIRCLTSDDAPAED